jgi:hypothetical protein
VSELNDAGMREYDIVIIWNKRIDKVKEVFALAEYKVPSAPVASTLEDMPDDSTIDYPEAILL